MLRASLRSLTYIITRAMLPDCIMLGKRYADAVQWSSSLARSSWWMTQMLVYQRRLQRPSRAAAEKDPPSLATAPKIPNREERLRSTWDTGKLLVEPRHSAKKRFAYVAIERGECDKATLRHVTVET
jgi:hypothetical protein